MSPSAEKHRRMYPNARPSKLRQLEIKDATTAQLQREIRAKAEADAKVNDFREEIGYRRRPSETETMFSRSVRAFSEFVSQLRA